ncbi:MAG: hypothetical protein LBL06_02970 [Treponema sp.]|jgi:hypothetical protein|nr:hypothetical protein [Treponema sp.]
MKRRALLNGVLVLCLVFASCSDTDEELLEVPFYETVNIAMINATYPVLDFALSIFEINENPTFVAIERKNTFDYDKLPENVYLLPGAVKTGNGDFFTVDKTAYINFVRVQADRETKFNLYLCDREMGLILDGMAANGIPETRYTVNLYLDGAIYGPVNRYTAADVTDAQALYDADCAAVDEAFKRAAAGTSWADLFNHPDGRFPLDLYYPLAVLNHLDNAVWNIYNAEAFKNAMPEALRDEVQAFIDEGKIVERTIGQKVATVKAGGGG